MTDTALQEDPGGDDVVLTRGNTVALAARICQGGDRTRSYNSANASGFISGRFGVAKPFSFAHSLQESPHRDDAVMPRAFAPSDHEAARDGNGASVPARRRESRPAIDRGCGADRRSGRGEA